MSPVRAPPVAAMYARALVSARTGLRLSSAIAMAAAVALLGGNGQARVLRSSPQAEIRVDQLGYAPGERKVAYLLAGTPAPRAVFRVVDSSGRTVLRGQVGPSRGRWNARFGAVQPIDVSALRAPGTFRISVGAATSPPFRVAPAATLFLPRVADTAAFFAAQRDGADVVSGPLHRRPAHLNDRHAFVYAVPHFESPDSDVITTRSLTRIGGPVDLEGGWMDAGDFVKFTHATAYADALLLLAQRQLGPRAPAGLEAEARFGLEWLRKAWDPRDGVMYAQVAIGSGNTAGTFYGDHDLWRLPERDDGLKGAKTRYLRSRPVFRANAPGTPVPPNLAGRVAASFALAAQLDAGTRRRPREGAGHGGRPVLEGEDALGRIRATSSPPSRTRSIPRARGRTIWRWPERSWRSPGERFATSERGAGFAKGCAGRSAYLRDVHEKDTLNLYDVSTLADAELVRAARLLHEHGSTTTLVDDLRSRLAKAAARSSRDPFGAAVNYADFDAASHAFGLVAIEGLYRQLTGDRSYAGFATAQRDWALGANPWGASLMIGVGTTFPRCPQHVVANLSGSLDGRPPVLRGAIVNGPNGAENFEGGLGGLLDGMRRCPPAGGDAFRQYTARGSRYVDDVRAWQTVEPAIDFTATAALAFAVSS